MKIVHSPFTKRPKVKQRPAPDDEPKQVAPLPSKPERRRLRPKGYWQRRSDVV